MGHGPLVPFVNISTLNWLWEHEQPKTEFFVVFLLPFRKRGSMVMLSITSRRWYAKQYDRWYQRHRSLLGSHGYRSQSL
jgi:hypothetical protein